MKIIEERSRAYSTTETETRASTSERSSRGFGDELRAPTLIAIRATLELRNIFRSSALDTLPKCSARPVQPVAFSANRLARRSVLSRLFYLAARTALTEGGGVLEVATPMTGLLSRCTIFVKSPQFIAVRTNFFSYVVTPLDRRMYKERIRLRNSILQIIKAASEAGGPLNLARNYFFCRCRARNSLPCPR